MIGLRVFFAFVSFLSFARPATADERLKAQATIDVPLTLLSIALGVGLGAGANRQAIHTTAPAARPGGIDRLAQLRRSESPGTASDYLLSGIVLSGLAVAAVDGASEDSVADRTLLYLESIALTGALTEVVKYAVRRPRPYTYDKRLGTPDDDLSFFSGHASHTAAATFATARSLDLTGNYGTLSRIALYGGASALSLTVASLRVAAGMHYPSDVLVGMLVGASVGWLVPELHRTKSALAPTLSPARDGTQLGVAFVF